ncbi:LysM peptidoglycan-binding domain-containing protein [Methylobacterium sp. C33D]
MTALRRVLPAVLIASLAGLAVLTALLGRRPRERPAERAEAPVPVTAPAARSAGGGRGSAIGLICLLLLMGSAGIVYESRDVLFGGGPREPDGNARPLAALSPQGTVPARPMARADKMTTGSVRAFQPGVPVTVQPARAPTSTAPGFDVVRIEPNGDAVIAGQAAPNAAVELLADGKTVARARANADGRFTFMPPPLPAGNSAIGLRATDAAGSVRRSSANVAVVIAPSRDARPLVAVTSPDGPTPFLSPPDRTGTVRPGPDAAPDGKAPRDDAEASERRDPRLPPRDGAKADRPSGSDAGGAATADAPGQGGRGTDRPMARASVDARDPETDARSSEARAAARTPLTIVAIDAQGGSELSVTARGRAGADLRLVLNDTLIAPATVGRDGTATFAIGQGVRPGDDKVRLDLVDPATGKVRDRAEVPLSAPAAGRDGGVASAAEPDASSGPMTGSDVARREPPVDPPSPPQPSIAENRTASVSPGRATGSSEVYVTGVETALIERGDSLWRISRRTYGEGERYALIYRANRNQIRDPDLIYPGQVLVLPSKHDGRATRGGRPR